jgi:hypothetical protein
VQFDLIPSEKAELARRPWLTQQIFQCGNPRFPMVVVQPALE